MAIAYDPIAWQMSEDELENRLRELLRVYRLYGFHCRDARQSYGPGFPDWCIISPKGVLFRELKSQTGELKSSQRRVRDLLLAAGEDWSLWRPSDLRSGRVEAELLALL